MKKAFTLFFAIGLFLISCQNKNVSTSAEKNKDLAAFLDQYYENRLKLYPLEATYAGDNRYNDQLPDDGSPQFLQKTKIFYADNLQKIKQFKREDLNAEDQLSYDIFTYEMQIALDGFNYHFEYLPFNQFYALPLTIGQLGSGAGAQPFKTVQDYQNWLKRVQEFSVWCDTAIQNFQKGVQAGVVLPKVLVLKIIPQMRAMEVTDPAKSLFYGPINNFPKSFSDTEKSTLKEAYQKAIMQEIVPTYKKLGDYLQNQYLPHARNSSGYSAMPGGAAMYTYLVKQQTTTNKTPEEIYQLGLSEVKRIRTKMDSIKQAVGFKGDLKAFFEYMKNDPKFMPYKTPQQVLAAFDQIHKRMEPNLKKMFNHVPKTPFEIRQTEAFRAASASAEYNQGSADGSRPGIFYVPILDATKFNTTSGMESLFLHEAIPGHHYQISLTQENTSLPKFRRFGGDNAYVEGWALYCESLGKELGLYTDPYQYMGALGDEIHRAIRLVVDVGIHTKNMTREQAIKYMMDNEAISEQGATAEIERYMAIPGQALGYKIGALKIRELRTKYEKELGSKFNLAEFHDQVLKDGSMPLAVFEKKMDSWAATQK
ncbi:MAG: DUF885 domain-containing protein [Janthinobacterium lividum]